MKNLQQFIYSSFLLTAVLAVPVAAQTVKTETSSASTNPVLSGNDLDQATIVPLFTLPESPVAEKVSPTTPEKVVTAINPSVAPEAIASTPSTPIETLPAQAQTANSINPATVTAQTLPTANPNAPATETMEQVTNVTQLMTEYTIQARWL
jgi:hypothetical protein